jgi:uncharacterized membrane protein
LAIVWSRRHGQASAAPVPNGAEDAGGGVRVEVAMSERRIAKGPPSLVAENIDAIVQAEEDALTRRPLGEAILEGIGSSVGTPRFVIAHAVIVAGWVLINTGLIPFVHPFDPYPYNLLSTVVSVEAVLLVAFVLAQQNRMSRTAEQRAHLDLQVNLLAEREASKTIQLLQLLCEKHGIRDGVRDPETAELSQTTQVEHFVDELRKRLPDD